MKKMCEGLEWLDLARHLLGQTKPLRTSWTHKNMGRGRKRRKKARKQERKVTVPALVGPVHYTFSRTGDRIKVVIRGGYRRTQEYGSLERFAEALARHQFWNAWAMDRKPGNLKLGRPPGEFFKLGQISLPPPVVVVKAAA